MMVRLFKLHAIARGGSLSLTFRSSEHIFRAEKEFAEVSKGASYRKFQLRGKAYAASVRSEEPGRGRKRVSRDQRRAMVESFAEKYRKVNGGKFPPVMSAVKEVGGSYYVVREILQELEYKSRMSHANKGIQQPSKIMKTLEKIKVPTPMTEVQDFTSCPETLQAFEKEVMDDKQPKAQDDDSGANAANLPFLKEESQEDCKVEEQSPSAVLKEPDNLLLKNTEEQSNSFYVEEDEKAVKPLNDDVRDCYSTNEIIQEVDKKEDPSTSSKVFHEHHIAGFKAENSQSSQEQEKAKTEIPEGQGNDTTSPEKSSLWGRLKSLATDVVKIWKNF